MAPTTKKWYFKDKSTGAVQGPFPEEKANKWLCSGLLKNQLASNKPDSGFKAASEALKNSGISISYTRPKIKINSKQLLVKIKEFVKQVDPSDETLNKLTSWAKEYGEQKLNEILREQYGVDLNTFSKAKKYVLPSSKKKEPKPIKNSFAAFLSHAWGKDAEGRDNHKRVGWINEKLKSAGLNTWYDNEQMRDNISKNMADGIENSSSVLAFITRSYMEKLNSDTDDNCKREFQYAVRRKTTANIIPIVMERGMQNTRNWVGPLGFELGGSLYVDMSTDASISENIEVLIAELKYRNSFEVALK